MSTSVASLSSNFFPSAQNGFTTTTSGSVASGATTVGLNTVSGWTNGQVGVFVIDPTDATKKQTFTGVIDTAGVQITSVVWTAGTNQIHALGATVVDYETATHWSMMSKGILIHADQDGTLKAGAVDGAGVLASDVVTTIKIIDAAVTPAKLVAGTGTTWPTASYVATAVGWAATPTVTVRYRQIGSFVRLIYTISGTSNTTGATMTLPIAARTGMVYDGQNGYAQDNGVEITTGSRWFIDPGADASLVNFYKNTAFATWTNSGSKFIRGTLFYEAA